MDIPPVAMPRKLKDRGQLDAKDVPVRRSAHEVVKLDSSQADDEFEECEDAVGPAELVLWAENSPSSSSRSQVASKAFGHESVRGAYEELGAAGFYAAKGASYVNPHEPCLTEARSTAERLV